MILLVNSLWLWLFVVVKGQAFQVDGHGHVQKDGENPILIIVPGLTSASDSAVSYLPHIIHGVMHQPKSRV